MYSGLQWILGSVPGTKYSVLPPQPVQASWPVIGQISALIRLLGRVNWWEGVSSRSLTMTLCQIGEAPVIPEAT